MKTADSITPIVPLLFNRKQAIAACGGSPNIIDRLVLHAWLNPVNTGVEGQRTAHYFRVRDLEAALDRMTRETLPPFPWKSKIEVNAAK